MNNKLLNAKLKIVAIVSQKPTQGQIIEVLESE